MCRIRDAARSHKAIEQELAHAVNGSFGVLNDAFSNKINNSPEVRKIYVIF